MMILYVSLESELKPNECVRVFCGLSCPLDISLANLGARHDDGRLDVFFTRSIT